MPSRLITVVAGLAVAAASSALAGPAQADPPGQQPKCGPASGDLTEQNLPEGSDVVACRAVGRIFAHGQLKGQIPAAGETLTMEALYPAGAVTYTISVKQSGEIYYDDPDAALSSAAAASSPSACSDGAYTDKDEEQAGTYKWYLGTALGPPD